MKTLVNRLAMYAASAVLLGTAAYGQTPLNANVPFAFHAAGATLAAGNYSVIRIATNGSGVVRLRNEDTRRSVLMVGLPLDTHSAGSARLLFACAENRCELRQVRTQDGAVSYNPARNRAHEAITKMVLIPLGIKTGV